MEFSIMAILLSIVLGVVTNLMTPRISDLFGKASESMKVRNEKAKQMLARTVQYLLENPQEEIIFQIKYLRSVLGLFLLLFFAIFLMLSEHTIVIIAGFLLSLGMYYGMLRLNYKRQISEGLIRRKKAAHPEINLF